MKALSILGAICLALIAGVGIGAATSEYDRRHARLVGALVWLSAAVLCGVLAWRL